LLSFRENRVFCILATDRQTDKQIDEQMDSIDALSRSRCRSRCVFRDTEDEYVYSIQDDLWRSLNVIGDVTIRSIWFPISHPL